MSAIPGPIAAQRSSLLRPDFVRAATTPYDKTTTTPAASMTPPDPPAAAAAQAESAAPASPSQAPNSSRSRLFSPATSEIHRTIPHHLLVAYNRAKQISQLQYLDPTTKSIETDASSLVLYTSGFSRDEGWPHAKASWGVSFGNISSRRNARGALNPNDSQTGRKAGIEALAQGLAIARRVVSEFGVGAGRVRRVYLVSDSEYLVNALSAPVKKGALKPNLRVMRTLFQQVDEMEAEGIEVRFWHVSKELDSRAHGLAGKVLEAPGPRSRSVGARISSLPELTEE